MRRSQLGTVSMVLRGRKYKHGSTEILPALSSGYLLAEPRVTFMLQLLSESAGKL